MTTVPDRVPPVMFTVETRKPLLASQRHRAAVCTYTVRTVLA